MLDLLRALFAPPRDLILLVAAGWAGLALTDKRAKDNAVGEKAIDTLVGAMVIAFVIGGRLLYAAEHFSAFTGSPASLFSLNASAFDAWGGIATAAVIAAVIMQRKALPFWRTLDLLTPLLAALAVGLALSHLATGMAFGKETNVPWAIHLWGAERHPTQLYELLAASGILGIAWYYSSRDRAAGKTFLMWLALTAGSRLIIEGFRGDSTLVFDGFRLAQIVAWVVLAMSLIGSELLSRGKLQDAPEYTDKEAATAGPAMTAATEKKGPAAPSRGSGP